VPALTIVDRYFISEVAKIFGAIMATLMLVMTSMLFLRTLEQVDVGSLASDSVLRFLGLQILRDTASLLPPAFFISALVTLGRMARDSELIAFNAGGLGPVRIYRSLLLFSLPLALLTGWLSLVLQPYASSELQLIEDLKNDQATQVAGLQAGRFYQQDSDGVTFYAGELGEDKRFRGVFIQDRRQEPPRIVLGDVAYYRDDNGEAGRAVVLAADPYRIALRSHPGILTRTSGVMCSPSCGSSLIPMVLSAGTTAGTMIFRTATGISRFACSN
jgi:lipopolysaccharide export system permease protein